MLKQSTKGVDKLWSTNVIGNQLRKYASYRKP